MKRPKITIHDVAREAHCSITTVSHALNDRSRVSPETRRKIKEIAERIGYVPNLFARSFVLQRSELIGVVVPGIITSFYPEIIQGVKHGLPGAGYGMALSISEDDPAEERRVIDFLLRRRIDGLIVAPCQRGGNTAYFRQLIRRDVPLVFVDRTVPRVDANSVVTDNVTGARIATEYLLGLGHRRIGVLSALKGSSTTKERLQGYREALAEAGVAASSALMKTTSYSIGGDSYRVDEAAIQGFLRVKPPPTALFVLHDAIAVCVVSKLAQRGVRVPEDMSVVGYDDLNAVKHLPVPLTTVAQPKFELGRLARDVLLEAIGSGPGKTQHVRLKPELIVRDSCRAPRKGRSR